MIRVNGDEYPWTAGMTVRDVLIACKYKFPLLVIKLNGRLIQRDAYDTTEVPDGAEMSVVHLMSGG